MNKLVKIIAYVVLTACVIGFGYGLVRNLPHGSEDKDPEAPNMVVPTNLTLANSNTVAAKASASGSGVWAAYFGALLLATVLLAVLAAYDFAFLFAHHAERLVFDDSVEVEKPPEYDEAEKVWANGQHLEAIELMRAFLTKNPQAQYAALRIAEIYEKDLGNPLAAALEYEEVLKKKLPAEKWGWTAIHLANVFSGKLNKPSEAEKWLRRIIAEYPQTSAAKKARERLGEPEPVPAETQTASAETQPPEEKAPDPPPSNLPPGFRPKA